ncbi:SdrD B-like domain-containing protein [Leucobacter massiliensis]|uniref:SD-repeat containing protein B domain-containing protein n=1 Tax=Leucobacter massiliensis TaxID=1686285 RepID=A0A2S9QLN4_9MICO|nr:SdrD B-like domain-containing protein [Leucobacter massiliensis]PRI10497.1 hypothetical protein B4915_10845 [Leucobacter massiliensis]
MPEKETAHRRVRKVGPGAAVGALALIAGLLVVPPAHAEETTPPIAQDAEATPGGGATPREAAEEGAESDSKPKSEVAPHEDEAPPHGRAGADDAPSLAPLAAGDGVLTLTVAQQTGTGPFQDNDDAGNDSGPDNTIVRTNDTVSYNVGIRYEGEDQTQPRIGFTLPQGQELVSLPPFCLPGSTVTPETIPAPAVPLTATSWTELPSQTVTCLLEDQAAGTSLNYPFISVVRSEVPNGTEMDAPTFSVSTNEVPEAVTIAPEPVTASATPRFDLSKRGSATQANQGPLFQGTAACPDDSGRICRTIAYPMTLTVPASGKGVAPLANPIIFEDNLDPATFFGAEAWAEMIAKAGSESAARQAYAPMLSWCGAITAGSGFRGSLPFSDIATGDQTNSVRDSGTVTCTSPGAGQNAVITITDMDTSAVTVPTKTGNGNALPANTGYVFSYEIAIAVPQDAVLDIGADGEGNYTLDTHNEFTNVQMTSIDGQQNSDDPANNSRDASIRLQITGGFDKSFTGIYGQPGNTPAPQFSNGPIYEGLPGSGIRKDGNTVVMPGQAVQSVMSMNESAVAGSGTEFSRTHVSCDVWDADRLALAAHPDWRGTYTNLPSNGEPVFPSYYSQGNSQPGRAHLGTAASTFKNIKIEYSSGPAGPGADSDCSTGTWSTNPDDIVAPTTDGFGRTVWNGINRVRITLNTEYPAGNPAAGGGLDFAIAQVVLDSDKTEPIGNWASREIANGVKSTSEALDTAVTSNVPSYDPDTHAGSLGDRLIQGEAIVRVKKYVQNPTTGEFVDSVAPQFTAGATVNYRLDPSLSTSVPVEGNTAEVVVEDCLPQYQVFSAAVQGGSALEPEVAQMGAPDGSELACPDDRQYVRWNLGKHAIGEPIEPIVVSAEVLDVARNGTYTNDVMVSSPVDQSPASVRDDDVQLQLVVPTGIKISKTVDQPVLEVNPDGITNPRSMLWSVYFANIDAPGEVTNVDVIDVLPVNGQNGSAFDGQLRFDSATVGAGSGMTILYTSDAGLNADPAHPSNTASGATVWCDAVTGAVVSGSGSAADCPQSAGEVTGLRFLRAGPFTPADDFRVDIAMTPLGNAGGDVYRNITAGRADGVSQGVGPAARTVDIISSSIGDRVWEDANSNGIQDEGEPGIAGFSVKLVGTDVDGNAVSLETVTDENGRYTFTNLASGTYRVIFDPNGLNSNTQFTTQHSGSDAAIDSDADPVNGQTQEFTLGKDTEDLTLDAGVVIDRNVDIVLDKKYLGATDLDEDRHSTVTYELEVTNHGTAEGPYDLTDTLKFGGDITIDDVTVANAAPGDIATNPGFDGQKDTSVVSGAVLPGGATHTYLVTVEATVETTITTEESECAITETESGSGFLNEAELSMNGETCLYTHLTLPTICRVE